MSMIQTLTIRYSSVHSLVEECALSFLNLNHYISIIYLQWLFYHFLKGKKMSYLFHILNSLLFCVNIYYSLTKEYDEINKVRL